jgi:uroporphyrin-III C-methyltransferase
MNREFIIVGAGLNFGSMTLAGLEAVKSADVILYDRLIDKEVLKHADCECVDVGKIPYSRHCVQQSDINALITKYLEKGGKVVRLKGGDSSVFARTIEEVETAKAVGANVTVIAGVTSASMLSSRVQSALTDRRNIPGVVFITGHTKSNEVDDAYNWEALAKLGFTLVIYMGVRNMGVISGKLIEHGMKGETPVMIGQEIGTSNERIMYTTLSQSADFIDKNGVNHPATIIIGDIAGNAI